MDYKEVCNMRNDAANRAQAVADAIEHYLDLLESDTYEVLFHGGSEGLTVYEIEEHQEEYKKSAESFKKTIIPF